MTRYYVRAQRLSGKVTSGLVRTSSIEHLHRVLAYYGYIVTEYHAV